MNLTAACLARRYADRVFYWCNRTGAKARMSDTATMIVDSMDKSKFPVPRFREGRSNKELENAANRPVMTLSAVVCHGYFTMLVVSHEGDDHGSNLYATLISLGIPELHRVCSARG